MSFRHSETSTEKRVTFGHGRRGSCRSFVGDPGNWIAYPLRQFRKVSRSDQRPVLNLLVQDKVTASSANEMRLDLKAIESTLTVGLPVQARWMIDRTPLDFEFTVCRTGLHRLPDNVLEPNQTGSSELLVFGKQGIAEGGGASPWLCVREGDGSVYGFDPERKDPMFLLNSSIDRFVATFRLLNDYLAKNNPLPPDCEIRLQLIDPDSYANSDWRFLAEYLQSARPDAAPGA